MAAIMCVFAASQIFCQNVPSGFSITTFAEGVNVPTKMVEAPDGRIFVSEKAGCIRIIENGILLDDPFYCVETEIPGERGITGFDLHPDFEENGFVYIYYTLPDQNRNTLIRVQSAGNSALEGSEETIFSFDQMWAAWHNGGGMAFDDEGFLFIGVGDGTGGIHASQMNTTLGKILRIDGNGDIPEDNPFYDSTIEDQKAIWALGIRNPYTMDIQKSTGKIFFNDVGTDEWEEINEVIEGGHYGWNSIEGPIEPGDQIPEGYQDPIFAYDHSQGCAIVGSSFYEPDIATFPIEYHGKFFFMDLCEGEVYFLDPDTYESQMFIEGLQSPNCIITLDDGSMLVSEIWNNRIFRIQYTGSGAPFIISEPSDFVGIIGENADFHVDALGEGELNYSWFLSGIELTDSNSPSITIPDLDLENNGNTLICEIENQYGSTISQEAHITVLNETRPIIQITRPLPESTYAAGDTLWFSATAEDVEDGPIDVENWEWDIYFHHNVHKHPAFVDVSGVSEGYYVIPDQGETALDVWFSVELKVHDSAGLTSFASVEVLPEYAHFSVDASPLSMDLSLDGRAIESGVEIQSVKSMKRTIKANDLVIHENGLYKFNSWGSSGIDTNAFTFYANDTIIRADYDLVHEYIEGDESEDVLARYYIGTDDTREFHSEERVSVIDGNWSQHNPISPWGFPNDNWSIQYSGSILAPYSGEYEINVYHDSQVKFVFEDEQLIDESIGGTGITTSTAVVNLQAGVRYNFILDYKHYEFMARVKLAWKFSEFDNHTIPHTQLYSLFSTETGDYLDDISVYPNPTNGALFVDFDRFAARWIIDKGVFDVYDISGRHLFTLENDSRNRLLFLDDLDDGVYILKLSAGNLISPRKIILRKD